MSWLIADIGGTHARFAQYDHQQAAPTALATLATADFNDLESAIEHYVALHQVATADRVLLALPCPVERDPIVLTNAGWRIQRQKTCERLALQQLEVVNDFYAQAVALPFLQAADLLALDAATPAAPPASGNRVVLGPGTGLGVAAMVEENGRTMPVTGEGGHVTLAAVNDYEDDILRLARKRLGHVSAEKLISGIGLSELEQCMALVEGDDSHRRRDTRAIVQAARAHEPRALATVTQMLAFLATVAADLALNFGAFGGVYFSGGILPRVREVVDWSLFHQRFVDKGRFQSYLEHMPKYLVTHQQPGLLGLAGMIRNAEQNQKSL